MHRPTTPFRLMAFFPGMSFVQLMIPSNYPWNATGTVVILTVTDKAITQLISESWTHSLPTPGRPYLDHYMSPNDFLHFAFITRYVAIFWRTRLPALWRRLNLRIDKYLPADEVGFFEVPRNRVSSIASRLCSASFSRSSLLGRPRCEDSSVESWLARPCWQGFSWS